MLDKIQLGEGIYFFFQTVKSASSDGVDWMQFFSTTMAVLFGAALTFATTWFFDFRSQKRRRLSLAISIIYKLSRAGANLKGLRKSFFEDVPDGTSDEEVWKFVRASTQIPPPHYRLSTEEFEFLLGEGDTSSPAYGAAVLIDQLNLSTHACNEYSNQRMQLDALMSKNLVALDQIEQLATFELPASEAREVEFKKASTAQLCIMLRTNLDLTIVDAEKVANLLNRRFPELTRDNTFDRRIEF